MKYLPLSLPPGKKKKKERFFLLIDVSEKMFHNFFIFFLIAVVQMMVSAEFAEHASCGKIILKQSFVFILSIPGFMVF